jgi:hypothetical protein
MVSSKMLSRMQRKLRAPVLRSIALPATAPTRLVGPGIVDALIRAEAMRTVTLLMSGLQNASCCEETYISAGLSSIARGLFRVRL